MLPGAGDVGLCLVRPAERAADSDLPLDAARDLRPLRDAESSRRHALPDVDERMPDDAEMASVRAARDGVGDPRLLRARDEVIDEDAVASRRTGRLGGQQIIEQIHALEELDDHSLDPQVGAPHLLDEFGIVLALDEDPTGQGHAGALVGDDEGTGCRPARSLLLRCGDDQPDRCAVDEEPPAEGEQAPAPEAVLQLDVAALHSGDRTAEAVVGDLDHEIRLRRDLWHLLRAAVAPARRQHIRTVHVVHASQRMCLR